MELSIKKIQKALDNFVVGNGNTNYKYNPTRYMFDLNSDEYYAYMLMDGHYFIRVPKKDIPQILSAGRTAIRTDLDLEKFLWQEAMSNDMENFYFHDTIQDGKLTLAKFIDGEGHYLYINAKFFKQFFNGNIIDKGIPANITFTGRGNKDSAKYPLVMWQDDEAIACFCPIHRI